MIINCSLCNCKIEVVDDIAKGQHIICPYCKGKFAYLVSPQDKPKYHRIRIDGRPQIKGLAKRNGLSICNGMVSVKKILTGIIVVIVVCVVFAVFRHGGAELQQQGVEMPQETILKKAIASVEMVRKQQYQQKKSWYSHQLDYNDMRELVFSYKNGIAHLWLASGNDQDIRITYMVKEGFIEYSRSIAKGYAQELIFTRMFIENYECPEKIKEDEMSEASDDDGGLRGGRDN